MRWKTVKLYEYSIYLIVFLYLGFINFFKDLNSLSISIGVFIFMFGLQLYRLNSFSLSGYTIKDALIHNRYYAYMLLTFPMTEVLATAKRRMKFINNTRGAS